ncbi:hypothetical protein BD311DRAFT_806375 [Dichomitus squalens]|uniref:Uncharacterized protein n=1 Tax=Dichomitus squalens TaxID=114155 RepID=A0A4Q9MS84_9APHY|nr:hypothetical protein BD311DRAFT_806375 [Dichomitus squalens]
MLSSSSFPAADLLSSPCLPPTIPFPSTTPSPAQPFSTRFFKLVVDCDSVVFVRRPMNMQTFFRRIISLQGTTGTIAPLPVERIAGAGFAVGGVGCSHYFVPYIDGSEAAIVINEPLPSATVRPYTYSLASDSEVDYDPDGFAAIDTTDATGCVVLESLL